VEGLHLPALVAELRLAFPRQKISEQTLTLYVRELADLPPAAVAVAVRQAIRTSRYFPEISDLRAAAAETALGLPDETAALRQVEDRQEWARDGAGGEPPHVDEIVLDAIRAVGGWHAFRASSRPDLVRREFVDRYSELRARAIRAVQAGVLELGPTRKELT
jgi:hypothetical protein